MKNKTGIDSSPAAGRSPSLADLQVAAIQAAADPIAITDNTGTVVWVNRAFEELTGYAAAEIVGKSTRILKSGRNSPELYADLWRTILEGRIWRGEVINRRKDGSFYDEEMTITPLRDATGSIGHFVALKKDITERKRAEAKNRMLIKAVESSPELIGMAGPDGRILYINDAMQRALRWSHDDLAGKHFRHILSPNNTPKLLQEIEQQSVQPGGWKGECLVPRKDGTDLPVLLSSSAVAENGTLLGILGIAQDITERKHAEERIAFLSQALENTSDYIGIGDTASRITYANQAWLRKMGYTEEELFGQDFDFVMSPENSAGLLQDIRDKTIAGGWRGECLHRSKDGTDFPVLLSTGVLHDRDGAFSGVFGIARDITERKRIEQEVLFKNTLLEAQAETTLDAILAVDEANRIILHNREFEKLWGLPPGLIHAGDDRRVLRHVADQVKDERQFLERVEYLYQHRDERSKDQFWLRDGRILDRYSSPLISHEGKYYGRIWYFRDITERIRAEERLQLWSQVLGQSAEGIFVCDPEERILLVNQAFEKITGFSAAETLGKTPRILQSGLQDTSFYAEMWKSVSEQGKWQGEIWNRRKTGEMYVEWLSISAVREPNGPVTHYVGIFSDITTHK